MIPASVAILTFCLESDIRNLITCILLVYYLKNIHKNPKK